jgi:hypothetical protein
MKLCTEPNLNLTMKIGSECSYLESDNAFVNIRIQVFMMIVSLTTNWTASISKCTVGLTCILHRAQTRRLTILRQHKD